MDNVKDLVLALRDLGLGTVTVSDNLLHIDAKTDDQVKLLAKQFAAVPVVSATSNKRWLSCTGRLDGTTVLVTGPTSVMAGTERAS